MTPPKAKPERETMLYELQPEVLDPVGGHVAGRGPAIVQRGKIVCRFPSGTGKHYGIAKERSEYFLRAVNAHEQLVAALRNLLDTYQKLYNEGEKTPAIRMAEAALRAAGEEI